MRRLAFLAALACIASAASGSDRPPPLPDLFVSPDGPMSVFRALELSKNPPEPFINERQPLSLVGRDDLINDRVYDPKLRPKCDPLTRSGKPVDPAVEIVSRAKSAGRLVIVNEAHDDPQTRAFIDDLLPQFRALGFSVYAAETFMPTVGKQGPTWPRFTDGFYSNEPAYGELIRRARALKFTFIPYEADQSRPRKQDLMANIADREVAQTQNIRERILRPSPHTKALIHVGHSHLNEVPIKWGDGPKMVEWMASRLKKASGIDPLTVDQTRFQSPLDRPIVCELTTEKEKAWAAKADLTIALPAPVTVRSRPMWRRARGQVDVAIPPTVRPDGFWTIVEARYAEEPPDAVPADRILVRPGEDLPLLLKPGKYRVEGWTREHGWTAAVDIVAAPAP